MSIGDGGWLLGVGVSDRFEVMTWAVWSEPVGLRSRSVSGSGVIWGRAGGVFYQDHGTRAAMEQPRSPNRPETDTEHSQDLRE